MLEIEVDQNSEEWHLARIGIPTASEFGKMLTGTGKPSTQVGDYAAQLAAELYSGEPMKSFRGNAHTDRGHALEEEARELYAFARDYELTPAGFFIEDTFFGLKHTEAGCSPDSKVKIPGRGHHPGLLEVKCLSAAKHVLAHQYFAKNKRPDPSYISQCQGQLLITGRRWVDLYFYHPELPELCIRINRDEEYQSKLVAQIDKCNAVRDELLATLKEAA